MTEVRTIDLRTGDKVVLPNSQVRTVANVTASGYVNSKNLPIYTVWYFEGTTADWGPGNTAAGTSKWQVVS